MDAALLMMILTDIAMIANMDDLSHQIDFLEKPKKLRWNEQLTEEKNDLQQYISKELTEKKWGYRGRIKIREKESKVRQDNLSQQISKSRQEISLLASNLNKKLNLYETEFNKKLKQINEDYIKLEEDINQEIDLLNLDLEARTVYTFCN